MERGELLDRVMNDYRRFYMRTALFSYPWSGTAQRRRYLFGCLKAFLKLGFERKFDDLGEVGHWGPQSRQKFDFHFDEDGTLAASQTGDWQANAGRSRKATACPGFVVAVFQRVFIAFVPRAARLPARRAVIRAAGSRYAGCQRSLHALLAFYRSRSVESRASDAPSLARRVATASHETHTPGFRRLNIRRLNAP